MTNILSRIDDYVSSGSTSQSRYNELFRELTHIFNKTEELTEEEYFLGEFKLTNHAKTHYLTVDFRFYDL